MNLSYVMSFIEALEDTWVYESISLICIGLFLCGFGIFIRSLFQFSDLFFSTTLFRYITKYVEFSLLRDFPYYVKTEKSVKWLDRVRLWFIRNG